MDVQSAGTRLLGGSAVALAAAVGLVRLGSAPFRLLRDALVWRAGEPFPDSLQHIGMTAVCSLVFGAAMLVALVGLFRLARVAVFSSLAAILVIASGSASAVAGGGLGLAAVRSLTALRAVVASAAAPTTPQLGAMVEHAMVPGRWGFAGLSAGAALLLVLACGSLRNLLPAATSGGTPQIVGGLAAASLVGSSVLLAATWFPMQSLAGRFGLPGPWDPSDLAGHVAQALQFTLAAAAFLLIYGVLLVLFGILLQREGGRTG